MPCLKAILAVFHASCSRASPFERVYFYRAVRHSRCVIQRSSRLRSTKLIYEPGFLEVFSKIFFSESSCAPGRAPSFAASSYVHRVTPFMHAELDASVVAQGSQAEYAPIAYPWGKTGRGNREVSNRPPPFTWISFSNLCLAQLGRFSRLSQPSVWPWSWPSWLFEGQICFFSMETPFSDICNR